MGKRIVRWLFAILGGTVGYGIMLLVTSLFKLEFAKPLYEILIYSAVIILFLLLFYVLSNGFFKSVRKLIDKVDSDIRKLGLLDIALGTIGILIGLGISYVVVNIISNGYLKVFNEIKNLI